MLNEKQWQKRLQYFGRCFKVEHRFVEMGLNAYVAVSQDAEGVIAVVRSEHLEEGDLIGAIHVHPRAFQKKDNRVLMIESWKTPEEALLIRENEISAREALLKKQVEEKRAKVAQKQTAMEAGQRLDARLVKNYGRAGFSAVGLKPSLDDYDRGRKPRNDPWDQPRKAGRR